MMLLAVSICLGGCSDDLIRTLDTPAESQNGMKGTASVYFRDRESAVYASLAHSKLKKNTRATGVEDIREVLPILRNKDTSISRADMMPELNDTVAYIINYAEDGGFTIVSADVRMREILAYSDMGEFSMDNPISKRYFVDVLSDYYESSVNSTNLDLTPIPINPVPQGYTVNTAIMIHPDQDYPYDMYVQKKHPGCPVGCVPVALSIVMSHCKDSFNYHGHNFDFANMREVIAEEEEESKHEKFGYNTGNKIYDGCIEEMAQLLSWIGEDIVVDYEPGSSVGSNSRGVEFLKATGYFLHNYFSGADDGPGSRNYPSSYYYSKFLPAGAIARLRKDYLLLMGGNNEDTNSGHSWVCHGADYCINPDTGAYEDYYFKIDWGWGGRCNGSFTGDVFSVASRNYTKLMYASVKIEGKLKK
ncbi:MAG: hypothetical protein HDS82_03435 [Bacteroidales bacterium]|nr:hypothetical protein [Bacteroidales bacterium]